MVCSALGESDDDFSEEGNYGPPSDGDDRDSTGAVRATYFVEN